VGYSNRRISGGADHHRVSIHPGAEHHGTSVPQKVIVLRKVTSLPLTLLNEIPELSVGANAGVSLDPQLKRYWMLCSAAMVLLLTASAVQLFWRERGWGRATLGGASVYVARVSGPAVVA